VSDATAAAYRYPDRSIDYDDRSIYVRRVDVIRALSPRVTVREAVPADLPELVACVERCSDLTLYRRFHGAAGPAVRRELRRIATPTADHRSWVATGPDGTILGTASLAWGRDGTVEAGFLVEDGWFRRGIGRLLFSAVAAAARASRVATVRVTIQAENTRALRFLRAMVPGVRPVFAGDGIVEATIGVAVADVPASPVRRDVDGSDAGGGNAGRGNAGRGNAGSNAGGKAA
jgi:GNAT superfamily N-acetyltransferase